MPLVATSKEEGYDVADYVYNPLSIDMQEAVLSKEELLNLASNSCSKRHQSRKSFRRRVTSLLL